jgi:hypothetical protein
MNYNRNVEFNDRYTTRLNSDKHNLRVKVALVRGMLDRQSECVDPVRSVILLKRVFLYMLKTVDTVLLDRESFAKQVLERALCYSVIDNITNENAIPTKIAKRLVRVSRKLVLKVKNGFTSSM